MTKTEELMQAQDRGSRAVFTRAAAKWLAGRRLDELAREAGLPVGRLIRGVQENLHTLDPLLFLDCQPPGAPRPPVDWRCKVWA